MHKKIRFRHQAAFNYISIQIVSVKRNSRQDCRQFADDRQQYSITEMGAFIITMGDKRQNGTRYTEIKYGVTVCVKLTLAASNSCSVVS